MTKFYFLYFIISMLAMFSLSCEEDFNPYGDVKDKYILSCILRSDTTLQVAFLSRSYANSGNNSLNTPDPNVRSADVRIWHIDSVYKLNEAPLEKPGNTSTAQYITRNFAPLPGEAVEIVAELQNGRQLRASTSMPQNIEMDMARSDTLIPLPGTNYTQVLWQAKDKNVFYVPRFSIIYFKNVNGNDYRFEKHIPIRYETKDGFETPVFASPSLIPTATIDYAQIDRAMREISEGDINKENYKINTMMLEVLILDMNLGAYYSASKIQEDGFTVKIDQTDYSNIQGGLGIFGAYTRKTFFIWFTDDYIKSFRYLPGVKGH